MEELEFRIKIKPVDGKCPICGLDIDTKDWFHFKLFDKYVAELVENGYLDVDTLGIYILQKDKFGTKIYGGDVVKATQIDNYSSDDKPFEITTAINVVFETEISGYGMGGKDGETKFENIEIIGNIYDNPELMKEVE